MWNEDVQNEGWSYVDLIQAAAIAAACPAAALEDETCPFGDDLTQCRCTVRNTSCPWDRLSDGELRARLEQRGVQPRDAAEAVADRDHDPDVRRGITALLGRE